MLIHILFVGYQNGRRFAFHADFGRNPQDKGGVKIKGMKRGARGFPCNSRFRWICNKHCYIHRLACAKDQTSIKKVTANFAEFGH